MRPGLDGIGESEGQVPKSDHHSGTHGNGCFSLQHGEEQRQQGLAHHRGGAHVAAHRQDRSLPEEWVRELLLLVRHHVGQQRQELSKNVFHHQLLLDDLVEKLIKKQTGAQKQKWELMK